ncbi:hypothetical protein A4U49_06020 [Acidithiobacillus ferrivorans]|uniref:hypothetical protein n=1 Tax=Acidithiobacillus ferrivorans TaxID=160808 RepID=UPI000892BD2E|nr:hypothetical protein [Acidithiobacillus ferrivorans]OFA16734.1 hypothetical protein A4U49_06020 [Acidithiobacillus ferrivorans]
MMHRLKQLDNNATMSTTQSGMSFVLLIDKINLKFEGESVQILNLGQSVKSLCDMDDLASMRVDAVFHGIGKTTIKRG